MHLPKKSTEILECLSFVIRSDLLILDYMCYVFQQKQNKTKKLLYILSRILPLWNSSSQRSERLSPRLSSSVRSPIKQNSFGNSSGQDLTLLLLRPNSIPSWGSRILQATWGSKKKKKKKIKYNFQLLRCVFLF